jgi:hypothetical protein
MPTIDPYNLGHKVTTRDVNWGDLVRRAWGSEFNAPDHGLYEWSNGRKFDSTDKGKTGVYGVDVLNSENVLAAIEGTDTFGPVTGTFAAYVLLPITLIDNRITGKVAGYSLPITFIDNRITGSVAGTNLPITLSR